MKEEIPPPLVLKNEKEKEGQNWLPQGRLAYLPVSLFASVMGCSGLTIGWMKFQTINGLIIPQLTAILSAFTTLLFLTLLALYAQKIIRYPKAVLAELHHPVKLNFFATISVSFLLLSAVYFPIQQTVSHILWIVRTLLHFGLTLYVMNIWIHHRQYEIQQVNPAWLIPAVGNVIVAIAGNHHGYFEISWFFFSVGMMFWIILMTIIMYRLLFFPPMDARLMPTVFILIAPPSVGFLAYVGLNDGLIDNFARFLLNSGLFLALLIGIKIRRFLRLNFYPSWWAYSFPLAAISIATMTMYERVGVEGYRWIGDGLFVILSVVVTMLIYKTSCAVVHGEICRPEG